MAFIVTTGTIRQYETIEEAEAAAEEFSANTSSAAGASGFLIAEIVGKVSTEAQYTVKKFDADLQEVASVAASVGVVAEDA